MPKVWFYKNKETGEFNGDATVTYEDPFAAMSAPKWFDGKEFKGSKIKVSMSNRKAEAAVAYEKKLQESGGAESGRQDYREYRSGGRGGGRDHRGGGGGGGRGRPGDWKCPSCGNNCFARKDTCMRCGAAKPRGGGRGDDGGGYRSREGDWRCSCGNSCFGWRDSCNRCGQPKQGEGSNQHHRQQGHRGYGSRDRHYDDRHYDDRHRNRSRSPRRR